MWFMIYTMRDKYGRNGSMSRRYEGEEKFSDKSFWVFEYFDLFADLEWQLKILVCSCSFLSFWNFLLSNFESLAFSILAAHIPKNSEALNF